MEISPLQKNAVRIKGKTTTFVINPSNSPKEAQAALYLTFDEKRKTMYDGGINVDSPGEYEVGGVKFVGTKHNGELVYTLTIDGISLLLGNLSTLESAHGKLQEHDLVLILADKVQDPSFASALATNGIIYGGEHVEELEKTFLKDDSQKLSKFSSTKEKLPQEMVTIVLQ